MKNFSIICLLIALLFSFNTVYAYDFEVDGIYYDVISTSELTCKVVSGDEKYSGDIVIPATVDYKNRSLQVIRISSNAFQKTEIISITMPNTVRVIEAYSFLDCKNLISIVFSESLTSIGNDAFKNCEKLSSIDLPDKLKSIDSNTFYNCKSLKTISIGEKVNSIGASAFAGCISLISIIIPNSVNSIADYAFDGCISLSSVTFSTTIESIGESAFRKCTSLQNIELPNSVTSVGCYAFKQCESLKNIKLSDNMSKIPYGVFENCYSLSSLTIPGNIYEISLYYMYESLNSSINSTYHYTFGNCEQIRSVRMEYGVRNLYCIYNGENKYRKYFNYCGWGNLDAKPEKLFLDRKLKDPVYFYDLKELELGEHISEVQVGSLYKCKSLKTIISYAINPPVLPECSNDQYMDVIVKVPLEALEAYQKAKGWKEFWNLEGDPSLNSNTSGVENIILENPDKVEIGRYDLNGRPVSDSYKGITIIRYSDGSTRKVINK